MMLSQKFARQAIEDQPVRKRRWAEMAALRYRALQEERRLRMQEEMWEREAAHMERAAEQRRTTEAAREAAMAARPWWKKFLGIAP